MPRPLSIAAVFALLATLVGVMAAAGAASDPSAAVQRAAVPSETIPMPVLRIEFKAGAVVLSGRVPDEVERDAIVRRLRSLYGAHQVTDRLETGGVANPSWLSASFIPDLRGMAQATAVLDDARLVIDGIARSAQAHAAVVDSVAGFGARGVKVDHRIEIRP